MLPRSTRRPAFPFALAALLSVAASCAPAEHVLLLEVRSTAGVDTLHVEVIRLDGDGPPTEQMQRVNRTRDSINNVEPIRVAISFPGPANVVVYVRASSTDMVPRTLLATRCYAVAGVVRDDVLLVQLDTSVDEDGDGFPRQATATCRDLGADGMPEACDIGACEDAIAADCDDNPRDDPAGASEDDRNRAADRYPGAPFFCADGIDQNCRIDDETLADGDEPCQDRDGDGWQACSMMMGACDCDDTNPAINPDATDVCGDLVDSDCSGGEALCDRDGDGVPADRPFRGSPDCNDEDPTINPDVDERCDNTVDDNCNGPVNEGCTDGDLDNDGAEGCPPGSTTCTSCDCNDCNGAVYPGAEEICDGIDNVTGAPAADCPGDTDRDGFVAPLDCAEGNPAVYQDAPEHCGDATSENCVDPLPMACSEGTDADMDGYTDDTRGQDCNDMNAAVSPAAIEVCNAVDDDCDDFVNEHSRALDDGGCVFDPRACPTCSATVPCAGGEECVAGVCNGACSVDFRAPSGSIDHCGGCGVSCNTAGMPIVADSCASGVCDCSTEPGTTACAVGSTCCPPTVRYPGCFDLANSARNCGFCGMVCEGLTAPDCVAGGCTCASEGAPCPAGLSCCGAGCVDLTNDDLNCGFCGHVCGANSHCSSGACTCDSADDFDCNGDLINATNDGCEARLDQVTRCGGCGTTCMTANVASASCGGAPGARTCSILSCNSTFANCNTRTDDGCETSLSTTSNCRACGTVCSPANATPACEATGCGYSSCNAGFGDCNGNRVDGCETPLNTTTNCRTCGTVCTPMNATARCEAAGCGYSACSTDFGDCNGIRSDGCEASTATAARCGACGTDCNALPNVDTVSCGGAPGARSCSVMSCDPGFGDCTAGPGCETPLRTLTNCTMCGDTCSFPNAAESCMSGTCTMGTCDPGFGDCTMAPGCETPLRTMSNCTMCGDVCDFPNAAESCATGTCVMGACSAGFRDCTAAPGCETAESASACGASCVNCPNLPNVATASCVAGACTILTCDPGFADCNGMPGCETDITTTSNCGFCGNVCAADMGPNDALETCTETVPGTYRCTCQGTTAPGMGEACPVSGQECCQSGMDCQTMC